MTGFVLLRVRAHRLLLAAALLTVVLTTSVLATFTAFAGAIGDAALRRTLQHQDADRATVDVHADVGGTPPGPLDAEVRKILAGSFAGLPAHIASSTQSGPYGLPRALGPGGASRIGDPDLTLLATFDRARVVLAAGSWPAPAAPGAGVVDVAVPQAAAAALKVAPGRQITLADRLGGRPLRVRVTGLYRPADATAPYWRLDPLGGRGVHTVAFTTYGPLLADPGTFTSGRVASAVVAWQAAGDFRKASTAQIGALQRSVRNTLQYLHDDQATGAAQAGSSLPGLLDGFRRSMLVTRSTLLIGALQLVILAGFALLLVAQLLAEERAGETALLRARGGSRARVGRLAAAEALLLAVPAAIAAPLLARPVTRLLAGTAAMTRTGAHLGDGSTGTAWLVAAGTALVCALAVIVPALRTGGSFMAARAARIRRGALPGALQSGADLGLMVVAGVAYWQLQRRAAGSGTLSAGASGSLGVDPVLVAAPALCLLAGTVLVLRLMPLVARLGERRAARGRGLALALAGWQLSRRPRGGAGVTLLLVLSVAMGMFAIGQGASWDRSQRDQADYTVGADVRVTGMTTPPFGQSGIYTAVPGITAAAAATRQEVLLPQERHATLLMMDTRQAGRAMRFRSDLTGGRPVADVLRPLDSRRPSDSAGLELPGSARAVDFDAVLKVAGADGRPLVDPQEVHLTATVVDRSGVAYAFEMGDVTGDGRPHRLVVDLASQVGTAGGAPAGPLRIVRLDVAYSATLQHESNVLTLTAGRIRTADGHEQPVPAPTGPAWTASQAFDDVSDYEQPGSAPPTAQPPRFGGSAVMSVAYDTGKVFFDPNGWGPPPGITMRIAPEVPAPPPLAGIATENYLKAVGAKVGSSVHVQINGLDTTVRIVGAVRGMPGTGDDPAFADQATGTAADTGQRAQDAGALLLDLRAVDRALVAHHDNTLEPTVWWLATEPGRSAQVAAALRARTDVDTIMVRDESADELRADPLGAGPRAALPAAVVAAAVLAALGFAVSSAGAIRERTAEFAVLRALGAPRRKLARMIAAEQGLLVLVSLVVGVVLGALLTRMVTPLIVLTAQAAPPVPKLHVVLPPGPLAELVAAVLVVPLLVVVGTALRRGDPASALRRQGEE